LRFPLTSANPGLFVIPDSFQSNAQQSVALAQNADGSQNSPTNPATPGSVISVFVNGLSADPRVRLQPPVFYMSGGWSVTNYSQDGPFVLKLNLQLPASSANFNCQQNTPACLATFQVFELTSYLSASQPGSTGGLSFAGIVYVSR
jgi:hypothetical protein